MTNIKAMKLALEALCQLHFAATERDKKNRVRWFDKAVDEAIEAIAALRQQISEAEQAEKPLYRKVLRKMLDAYEQAEQEPVAWLYDWEHEGEIVTGWVTQDFQTTKFNNGHNVRPLYTAPPQREWVSLSKTDLLTEAVEAGFMLHTGYGQGINKMMPVSDSATLVEFARAIEAKLKEKNR